MSTSHRLVWVKPDGTRVEFPLSAEAHLVGREGVADIQVREPLVSRNHARLERRGENWVVLDLDSTNFTRVNGNRVGVAQLHHGDELTFGRARCIFLAVASPDPAAEA
jgi:pSer/pThr/pTyr-binding forkhead associated (FHA) protein